MSAVLIPLGVIFCGLLGVIFFPSSRRATPPAPPSESALPAPNSPAAPAAQDPQKPSLPPAATAAPADFKLRPFPVVNEGKSHQWTSADGKDTNVILQLAHNPLEYARMVEENSRIKRRQLVYRKETVPQLLQQLQPAGARLQSFTLPGLDGAEFEVEVTDTKVNGAAQSGSVNGRVKGRSGSMVSVGFYNGSESFNILSPEDGIYLTADAREPGEVIVKEIDPDKYSPPAGNTPDYILTDELVPNSRPVKSNSK